MAKAQPRQKGQLTAKSYKGEDERFTTSVANLHKILCLAVLPG